MVKKVKIIKEKKILRSQSDLVQSLFSLYSSGFVFLSGHLEPPFKAGLHILVLSFHPFNKRKHIFEF